MRKIFPAWAWKPYHFLKKRFTRPDLLYVETHLTDHCNLNCKGCGHFSSISDKWFADVEQHRKEIRQLAKLFRNVTKIRLMGGEPLLHPRVTEFLKVTRDYLPKSDIRLVTNGILLSKMTEEFWIACRQNRVTIDMTVYPPLRKQAQNCIQLAKSKAVPIECTETGRFDARLNLGAIRTPQRAFRHASKNMAVSFCAKVIFTCVRSRLRFTLIASLEQTSTLPAA